MTDSLTRTRLLVALVVVSMIALALVAAGGAVPGLLSTDSPDRPDDPTTEDTVGYVDGYWYDDDLAADDRDDAVVEDDELEAVVSRSMARVERIRDMTFEDDVPVDVISREEFQEDDEMFAELNEDERRKQNVTYEALFMVDNETSAPDELEAMYGDTVGGYYDPATDRIVLVSNNPETPEVNEAVLGHELVHALQDQHFDLDSYDRATIDRESATNGLIEGDAASVETEYEQRCESEWNCLPSTQPEPGQFDEINWGIYMTLIQPYQDGPEYVEYLYETGDGWSAVDAAYDEPPTSSSEVIHPDEDRDPVDIDIDDRSNESWDRLEVDGEVATETVGEAGMVAMFGADAHNDFQPSVIGREALLSDDLVTYEYDQPYTDGWAGDELVTYVSDDAANETAATTDDAGYVWQTEWSSSEDAEQFASGYLELLDIHGAESVDDRQNTHVVDESFPGAYALERDGETVTIVRAPSVADLDGIANGIAADGSDSIENTTADGGETNDDGGNDDGDGDSIPGFAAPGTVVAVSIVLLAARVRGSVRPRSRR